MSTKTTKQWANLSIDSVVTLTDEQSLNKFGVRGKKYFVKSKFVVKETNELCTWIFYKLDKGRYLMVKIVDAEIDFRVYDESPQEFFALGDRNDWVNVWKEPWLFAEPDKEDWVLNDLAFTAEFEWDFSDGTNDKYTYVKKMDDMGGDSFEIPKPTGIKEPLLATIAEYSCKTNKILPEALVLENGDAENENGGLLKLMFGYPVNPGDIDVLDK